MSDKGESGLWAASAVSRWLSSWKCYNGLRTKLYLTFRDRGHHGIAGTNLSCVSCRPIT